MRKTNQASTISQVITALEYICRLTVVQIRQSVKNYTFGIVWWLADPVINTVILYLVTVVVMGRRTQDTAVFLLVGLLMFRFLQTAISGACTSIIPAIGLSNRLYIPKHAFVIRDVLAEMLKLFIGILLLFMGISLFDIGHFSILQTLIVTFVAVLFTLASASIVALVTAIIPDFRLIVGYTFRALFFVSGTFFSLERVPEEWKNLFLMNPFALLMHELRIAMIYPDSLNLNLLGNLILISLAMGVIGYFWLVRLDRSLPKYVL